MSLAEDRNLLRQVGIDDIDMLVRAAAQLVRLHPLEDIVNATMPLSEQEVRWLRDGGARGLDDADTTMPNEVVDVVADYARLVASAHDTEEAARRLGVVTSRVRQRVLERSLYAMEGPAGRVFPRFQFGPSGALPGLARVLTAIDPSAHPLAVERLFLTPSPDLESDVADEPLCPRDWLVTGHPVEPVVMLAREL